MVSDLSHDLMKPNSTLFEVGSKKAIIQSMDPKPYCHPFLYKLAGGVH